MIFTREILVEFNHCDPASRVFYPRYFEMINSVVECFFAEVVGRSFADIHRGNADGVPTVDIQAQFPVPTRHGERLRWECQIEKIGGASLTLSHRAVCNGETRATARQVLVWVSGERAAPWPSSIRQALTTYEEQQG